MTVNSDAVSGPWVQDVERTLGATVLERRRVSGGDFASAWRVTLDDGRAVFVKTHADPPPGFFVTEATGLSWLRECPEVNVPRVLGVCDDPPWLALDWVEVGRGDRDGAGGAGGEAGFGRALAALHATGAACFGREDARTTGSLAVPNQPCGDWTGFYAERRLLPLARLAAERQALPARTVGALERVAGRLHLAGASDEPAARLHGDLWAGNRVIDAHGTSWLIDPAAHGGHREFDLAMMRLFGGFAPAVFDAYHEAAPLEPGWPERVPLHQLAPLVVHAIKFGGSYATAVAEALRRCP